MDELIDMAKDFIAENVLHMEKPEADLTDVEVKHIDRSALSLESNVAISNPYSHDLPIFELSSQIKSGGRYKYIYIQHECMHACIHPCIHTYIHSISLL